MASVTEEKTPAQIQLDFALGKSRINLNDLSDHEFCNLLEKALNTVDLRELRGFRPLKDVLTFRTGLTDNLDLRVLRINEKASLAINESEESPVVDWKTHTLSLCRGCTKFEGIFRRHETGEETNDYQVASTWGSSGYLSKGKGEVLAIMRPRNHASGDQCLFTVQFWYEKIPLKHEHIISEVKIQQLMLNDFRNYFGDKSSRIAIELIRELRSALGRTVNELKSQTETAQRKSIELNRLSEAISYS